MAFQKHRHRGGKHHPSNRPSGPQKPAVPVVPEKVYGDADIHMDIVDASFVDVRGVETKKHEDGSAMMEYLSEKEAKARGFHDAWLAAEAIDKGLKHQEETN